jgi:hypothetical protein
VGEGAKVKVKPRKIQLPIYGHEKQKGMKIKE